MGAGFDEFKLSYDQAIGAQARIERTLQARAAEYFSKANVVGFGVGEKNGQLVPVFFVTYKFPSQQLAKTDRLPASIQIGSRAIPTDVVALGGFPEPAATPIGDPTTNRKSYRVDGSGKWEMGTAIGVFSPAGMGSVGMGTSGALVKKVSGGAPLVLSCRHVLYSEGFEVAQYEKTRQVSPGMPPKLNNFVGTVNRLGSAAVDAGLVECSGAERTILNVGAPRPPQAPKVGAYVQKSGAATGVTWGQVAFTNQTLEFPTVGRLSGLAPVLNVCEQDPPNPTVIKPEACGRFVYPGDSGSLVVMGRPNHPDKFGAPDIQDKYDKNVADRDEIRATYERAALGLLVGQLVWKPTQPPPGAAGPPVAMSWGFFQDLSLILADLEIALA